MTSESYVSKKMLGLIKNNFEGKFTFKDGKFVLQEPITLDFNGEKKSLQIGDSFFSYLLIFKPRYLKVMHMHLNKEGLYSQQFFEILFQLNDGAKKMVIEYLLSIDDEDGLLRGLRRFKYLNKLDDPTLTECIKNNREHKERFLSSMLRPNENEADFPKTPDNKVKNKPITSPEIFRESLNNQGQKELFEEVLSTMKAQKNEKLPETNVHIMMDFLWQNKLIIIALLLSLITVTKSNSENFQHEDDESDKNVLPKLF